jgi:HNH endonuclease
LRGVCESCGAATNKGNAKCCRCRGVKVPPRGYIPPSQRGTCSRCGKTVQVGPSSAAEPVCHPCRRQQPVPFGPRPGTPKSKGNCATCGGPLYGQAKVYCSLECCNNRPGLQRRQPQACEICGKQFKRTGGMWRGRVQRTCSRVCGQVLRERNRQLKPPKPVRVYHCIMCGRERAPGERWRTLCSYRCRVNASGERVNDLYRLACAHGWAGARWRNLLVGYLRERDGDCCPRCRKMIRFGLPSGPNGDPSGLGPSIDHVMPRSRGGSDDLANLRLMHWRCNRARRTARHEAIQVPLFG